MKTITGDELYKDDSQTVADRVEDLLSRMTLVEKVAQLRTARNIERIPG